MGQLEVIDILCDVTSKMSDLILDMTIQLEQANIAEEVMIDLKQRQKECSDQLDIAEYKMRRRRDE